MARSLTRRRWILLGLAVLAVTIFARAAARDREPVVWGTVERVDLDLETPFTGRLRALEAAEYGPPILPQVWEYRLTYLAPEGTEVALGDAILRFETSGLEESLRRHVADRDAAQKEYEQRRSAFEADLSEQQLALEESRTQERKAQVSTEVPKELVARTILEKAAVDLELARNSIAHRTERIEYLERRSATELSVLRERRDRAAAAASDAERAVELMTVRATAPGVVSHRTDRRGNRKKVGDACWRGERVVEIPAPGALRVDAWVKEAESGGIRVGLPATLRLESHPDRALAARVEAVQQTVERRSELDPGPIVRLELSLVDADPDLLRPGKRVHGAVLTDRHEGRLVAPAAAVRSGPSGPLVVRKTLFGGALRDVELGTRSGDRVEIVAGLEAGDRVLVTP